MNNNSLQYPAIVQAMLEPGFYPEKPATVVLVQTQMSFLFLAGEYVYKLKKPVNLGYLDYTTLEKRRDYCEREVVLNRRLCPDTYLAVITVYGNAGKINMNDGDEVFDYAVKMRRLPHERMLNILLEKEQVSTEMMNQVARKMADFHSRAETNDIISTFGGIPAVTENTEENFSQTENVIGLTVSAGKYNRIKEYTRRFLVENRRLFEERVSNDRIRDCHGDLHAAHICFTDGICIYDCIEFNERFRYCDVASEIAFLAMDLDHYGRADLSWAFHDSYVNYSRDKNLSTLFSFYKGYRAYVRAKVEGFKLNDPYISAENKSTARNAAAGYFDLAGFYIRPRPTLFIMVGVTGSGKSTVAQELAGHTGAITISSDLIRKQLAGVDPTEHRYEEHKAGIYSPEFTDKTYDAMFSQAKRQLSSGRSVILDATFIKKSYRQKARSLAEECGVDFYILECKTDESTIRKWLGNRDRTESISDGRLEILRPQMGEFEPVDEFAQDLHLEIDMDSPMESRIKQIMAKLDED